MNVVSSGRALRNCCCRDEERWPDGVSSTCGRVLKILPVCTIKVLQMMSAVVKSSSVQVSFVRISPVSRIRRAERIRMILKAERPKRRTDAIMYSPWVFIWEV